jgi:hypothetical protein
MGAPVRRDGGAVLTDAGQAAQLVSQAGVLMDKVPPLGHHPECTRPGVRIALVEMPDGRLLDKDELMKRPHRRRLLTV